jgi:hypothetical protein
MTAAFVIAPAAQLVAQNVVGPVQQSSLASSPWLQSQDMSGSSAESEQAIDLALTWLAQHQFANGGWSFDHRLGPCRGRCSNPGKPMAKAVNGATGMALLPFIDHGNTHTSGPYRQNVAAGLQFLLGRIGNDGSLWENGGVMYSHALGMLAFCEDQRIGKEAAALPVEQPTEQPAAPPNKNPGRASTSGSRANQKLKPAAPTPQQRKEQQQREALDKLLPLAASKSLAFSLACQDPHRGGWRYETRHPDSDISVTGWQVMAFHSATAIDLPIPERASVGVTALLDSLQGPSGATYGYRRSPSEATPSLSAIGLLCRIYTGWNRQQIVRGAEILATVGPSENDMYFNYYATLVLHHCGGPQWDEWNRKLRAYLIRTQSHNGHETGSWSFAPNMSNAAGGRHFDTCMACLILETYYRSKPAYAPPAPLKANVLEGKTPSP